MWGAWFCNGGERGVWAEVVMACGCVVPVRG